jgi:hypothetical protein
MGTATTLAEVWFDEVAAAPERSATSVAPAIICCEADRSVCTDALTSLAMPATLFSKSSATARSMLWRSMAAFCVVVATSLRASSATNLAAVAARRSVSEATRATLR